MKQEELKRLVICSCSKFEILQKRLYNHRVEANIYCPNDHWYYLSSKGVLRHVIDDKGIYISNMDDLDTFRLKRIR